MERIRITCWANVDNRAKAKEVSTELAGVFYKHADFGGLALAEAAISEVSLYSVILPEMTRNAVPA